MKKKAVIALILFFAIILLLVAIFLIPKKITVTFNSDNGSEVLTKNVTDGKVEKPEDPVREGYTFEGWYEGDEIFDFNSNITEKVELVAKWKKNSELSESFVVSFDSDGGSSVEELKAEEGSSITKPTNPTREGYTFVEWQLNGQSFNFDSEINENITLKAVWKKNSAESTSGVNSNSDETKYSVVFDSDGGSKVSTKTVTEGNKVSKPKNPTRNGYTFVEWQLNGQTYNFSSKVTANITLKAVWNKKAVTYSIKWVKVDESTADQYRLYIVDSNGKNVKGTVKVNYIGGGSQTFTVETSGKMFAYKTTTIDSVTVVDAS